MFWYPLACLPFLSFLLWRSKQMFLFAPLSLCFPRPAFLTLFFLMREKTKRSSFILTQRKMFMCPLHVSRMAFPSFLPSLCWWRERREVTLNGIGVSQTFLFLLSPNPIQPLEAEESAQHFYKGPLTQRSNPLHQGGCFYTRIRLGSGPEIAGLVGISLWPNEFVKHHNLDHTWRSMMLINILKALRHRNAKTSV